MSLLGINLTILIGPTVPVPAPPQLVESIQNLEVTHNDEGRSGFQITFQVGRGGPSSLIDYPLLSSPLLKTFNRIILLVTLNAIPRVLMDGIITNQELQPGNNSGSSTLTITGEDVSIMMDMEEKTVEHRGQPDEIIVSKIIMNYPQYGFVPEIIPPSSSEVPNPLQRIPIQHATDLDYIKTLAERYGYVFFIKPGPVCLTNTAYWGPPIRTGTPQRALSVNLGPTTNVESVSFRYDGLAPSIVSGFVNDSDTNLTLPLITTCSTRPPLSSQSALSFMPNVRKVQPEKTEGVSYLQAMIRAQGKTDASLDQVVTANGELNALAYGNLLQPRELVGLRGAGYSYDGLYYVKNVSHSIQKGEYKQRFTLTREGTGSIIPLVIP